MAEGKGNHAERGLQQSYLYRGEQEAEHRNQPCRKVSGMMTAGNVEIEFMDGNRAMVDRRQLRNVSSKE